MRKVLILGGASAIARETAKLFAANGDKLYLVDVNEEHLLEVAKDLKLRGATNVETKAADLTDLENHSILLNEAEAAMDGLDTVFIAYGTLSKQKECEASVEQTLNELQTNYVSVVSLLTNIANRFEQQKKGSICVISSVAGDRGRASNYVYGSAKGGLSIFLQGLRGRLNKVGVNVTNIKPGFVDTPMTDEFEKQGMLWASAETVGKGIYNAIQKGKGDTYVPSFWWLIMFIIRSIPDFIFKKLSI